MTVVLLIGFIGNGPGHAQEITNLLLNGGFETGVLSPWNSYANAPSVRTQTVVKDCVGATVPEGPIEGSYCLNVNVTTLGANNYAIGLSPRPQQPYQQGKKYTFSVFLKCKTGTLQVTLKPELAADPWTGYGSTVVTMTDKWAEYYTTTPVFASTVMPGQLTMHIGYALAEFWVDDAKFYEGDYVPTRFGPRAKAENPNPKDDAVDVPRDVVTSWTPGVFADKHDVYLGTAFADVNDASRTNPLGVLASQSQDANTFDPAGLLQFSQTYYWRVDEVNAPPDYTIYKGDVWTFTAEPYVYPIRNITATASSSEKAANGPQNTINDSGLTNDLHSTASTAMWLSSLTGTQPTWIQYEFDKVYKLYELWVWNYNVEFEMVLGYGFKDVAVEYSLDGTNWTMLGNVQFAQAMSQSGYAHNTTVDLGGVTAKYVKLTANSNWSPVGLQQYGLSEVRFYYVPVQAREPKPAAGQKNVALDAVLDWRGGREAALHEVYFSSDKQAVVNGTALVGTVTENSYQPASLEFGKTYYWKVNEVNEAASPRSWEGDIWRFYTLEYFVVDDFEDYNDFEPDRIFDTWIDGWADPANGSQVGYAEPPFAEKTITHGGKQSMPFDYNNTSGVAYSEAERTFASPQDWSVSGAKVLSLWFRGIPASVGSFTAGPPIYRMTAAGADIWDTSDQFHFAYKQLSGNGSITARVVSLTNTHAWAKAGVTIRESLAADSIHADVVVTPTSGAALQRRLTAGGSSTGDTKAGIAAPQWVRLTRSGNTFTAEHSANGTAWTALGTPVTIPMLNDIYIGLCLTSHNVNATCTAEFSDVTTTGIVTGDWQSQDIGIASNQASQLYVALADSAGNTATVKHPDSAATTIATWTEWPIDQASFTGVNLQAIKKMIIGVGDKANPTAPGQAAGRLYIDDIKVGNPILPIGLVAYYAMENNTEDSSGNNNHGIAVGSPVYVAGPAGKGMAIQFSGAIGQYVDLGTFNPSEVTDLLSVSLWAKWNGLSGLYQGLIAKRNTWNAAQMMWQIEANQATGALTFSRQNSYPGSGNPVLPIGEWAHLAVTFDGAIARFYVNSQRTGQGTFSFGSNKDATMHIGCCDANGGNPFNGALDEVRLYDIVLSDAEISTLAGK